MAIATLTYTGRAALAAALKERPLYLAWGSGDVLWDTDETITPILSQATALTQEVGRRFVRILHFVEQDPEGDITIPTSLAQGGEIMESRFKKVDYPTPNLYIKVQFAFGDAMNVIIREMALFSETEVLEDIPEGQDYLLPHQVKNKGLMIAAQRITPPVQRSPSIRQTCEFVITI